MRLFQFSGLMRFEQPNRAKKTPLSQFFGKRLGPNGKKKPLASCQRLIPAYWAKTLDKKSLVRASLGAVKICSGVPFSAITP